MSKLALKVLGYTPTERIVTLDLKIAVSTLAYWTGLGPSSVCVFDTNFDELVKEAKNDPALPTWVDTENRNIVSILAEQLSDSWTQLGNAVAIAALTMHKTGVHDSIIKQLLAPFTTVRVIWTGSLNSLTPELRQGINNMINDLYPETLEDSNSWYFPCLTQKEKNNVENPWDLSIERMYGNEVVPSEIQVQLKRHILCNKYPELTVPKVFAHWHDLKTLEDNYIVGSHETD